MVIGKGGGPLCDVAVIFVAVAVVVVAVGRNACTSFAKISVSSLWGSGVSSCTVAVDDGGSIIVVDFTLFSVVAAVFDADVIFGGKGGIVVVTVPTVVPVVVRTRLP